MVKIKGHIHQFIKDQRIRVKKHEGRIVWDVRQTFDFVAIGIICAECRCFQTEIISASKAFSKSRQAGFWMRGSSRPTSAWLGFCDEQLALELGAFRPE